MTSISIRLDEKLFHEMKTKAHRLHLSQTDYIRKAIEQMNHEMEQQERKERIKRASLSVRKANMKINAEFIEIEYDPEA